MYRVKLLLFRRFKGTKGTSKCTKFRGLRVVWSCSSRSFVLWFLTNKNINKKFDRPFSQNIQEALIRSFETSVLTAFKVSEIEPWIFERARSFPNPRILTLETQKSVVEGRKEKGNEQQSRVLLSTREAAIRTKKINWNERRNKYARPKYKRRW